VFDFFGFKTMESGDVTPKIVSVDVPNKADMPEDINYLFC
jgi:hypothetical protein